MRTFEVSNVVNLGAEDFWTLKLDASFERFAAEAEGCFFHITNLMHGLDANGSETVTIESEVTAEVSPLPTALQALLQCSTFALSTRSSLWRKQYDQEHPLTFETTPRELSRKKVVMRGRAWVEPLSADSCRVHHRVEIECSLLYLSLSKLLEQGLEKWMRGRYAKLAAISHEYFHNKETWRHLLDTPETIDRHLRATATPVVTTVGHVSVLDSPLPPPPPPAEPVAAAYLLAHLDATASTHQTPRTRLGHGGLKGRGSAHTSAMISAPVSTLDDSTVPAPSDCRAIIHHHNDSAHRAAQPAAPPDRSSNLLPTRTPDDESLLGANGGGRGSWSNGRSTGRSSGRSSYSAHDRMGGIDSDVVVSVATSSPCDRPGVARASLEVQYAANVGPDSPFLRFRSPFVLTPAEPASRPSGCPSGGETFRAAALAPLPDVNEDAHAAFVVHHEKHTARQLLLWTCEHGQRQDDGDHTHHPRPAARWELGEQQPKSEALSALTASGSNATPLRTPTEMKRDPSGASGAYVSPRTSSPSRTPAHRASTLSNLSPWRCTAGALR